MKPNIVAVVPSIRPEQVEKFREAWSVLFKRHNVTLIVVWDGERPYFSQYRPDGSLLIDSRPGYENWFNARLKVDTSLFCRFSDVCRNAGFVAAAALKATHILTLDDDVEPTAVSDPIEAHLETLYKKVPTSWMNTAHKDSEYLRGVPYEIRDEAQVMLSHGVWCGTPDFDGETQLRLEKQGALVPSLPYYVGPVPRGVLFPLCGMNVMVRAEALPYFYFAPMGPDSGVEGLHRFGDIWMGIFLKRRFDEFGWACYTGASMVFHSRASDARKNVEQEKLGREWNEWMGSYQTNGNYHDVGSAAARYIHSYREKRSQYAHLIRSIQEKS